jgi:hypothetical protein
VLDSEAESTDEELPAIVGDVRITGGRPIVAVAIDDHMAKKSRVFA